jgi:hypothetical protein
LRYFFHVTNGSITLKDEVGQDLFSLDAVKAQAGVVATELAQDDGYEGWAVRVVDNHGKEVMHFHVPRRMHSIACPLRVCDR